MKSLVNISGFNHERYSDYFMSDTSFRSRSWAVGLPSINQPGVVFLCAGT